MWEIYHRTNKAIPLAMHIAQFLIEKPKHDGFIEIAIEWQFSEIDRNYYESPYRIIK